MLAEIERRLVADDPGLASCLTTFRRPGPATVLRSPRARIIGSLFTVLLVAMVSLMVYAMIPFRAHIPRHSPPASAGAPSSTSLSVSTSGQPNRTQQSAVGASTGTKSTASQGAANSSATGKQQPKVKATSTATVRAANP
jgi:cytoskeletal protein RodZ